MSNPDAERSRPGLEGAELFFLLGLSFQLVLGEFVARLDAQGYADLRPIHGLAFQAILGGATTSTELAEKLGVTKQAAGGLVTHLESAGYVERRDHPAGGRRRLLALTREGAQHITTAATTLRAFESDLEQSLSPEEMAQLRRTLTRLIGSLAGDSVPPLRPTW